MPSKPGSIRSSTTRSGLTLLTRESPSVPFEHPKTKKPSLLRLKLKASRMSGSSSIITIFLVVIRTGPSPGEQTICQTSQQAELIVILHGERPFLRQRRLRLQQCLWRDHQFFPYYDCKKADLLRSLRLKAALQSIF